MTLLKAERDGRRFVNPVPTKVGGLSIMFKVGPRFFLERRRDRRGSRWDRSIPMHEFMQRARGRGCAQRGSVTRRC